MAGAAISVGGPHVARTHEEDVRRSFGAVSCQARWVLGSAGRRQRQAGYDTKGP